MFSRLYALMGEEGGGGGSSSPGMSGDICDLGRYAVAVMQLLVVKHADIKSVSAVFHIFRFYICVFYHQSQQSGY